MPYVPGHSADVFVSYAHVDNQKIADRRWVSDCVEALAQRLDAELGVGTGTVSVWKDERIDGSQGLTRQLLDSIDGAATLLCFVSVGYLQSTWCTLEWTNFLKSRQRRPGAGRVYLVFIRDIPRATLPQALLDLDLPGYEFWERDKESGNDYTVGGPGEPSDQPLAQIHRQLTKRLVRDMSAELRRLRTEAWQGRNSPTGTVVTHEPARTLLSKELDGQCIYLAEVTDDLDEIRDGVRRYLEQRSAKVVPAQWYPNREQAAYAAAARADIARATSFVQLLGPGRGREKSPAMPLGLPGLQHALAVEARLPMYRWRPEDLDTSGLQEDWREFVEAIGVTACAIEAFKALLLRRLTPPPPPPPSGGGLVVFVNSDRADEDVAAQLLADLQTMQVTAYTPFWDQGPKEFNAERKKLLRLCHGIIHVYGRGGPLWVRRQLLESTRVFDERRESVRGKAIGDALPVDKPKLGVALPDFKVINCMSGVNRAELVDFVNRLGG